MKTLLIDGDNLFKIGVYGVKNYYHKGQHIGGLYHFLNTIRRHLDEYHYDKCVVFWDGDNNCSLRKTIYSFYKENRRGRPTTEHEETSNEYQRNRIKQYLEELFVRQGEYENVETDDCMAYYCNNSPLEEKVIFSGDVDLTQLISQTVKVFSPRVSKFITWADKVQIDNIDIPPQNVSVTKIICGDSSDNVSGIKSMGIKTLSTYFPKILSETITITQIREQAEELFKENKNIKAINNLLTGTSKHGVFGEEFFTINKKIVDLSEPLLTESAKNDIINIINEPLDPEDRGWKNIVKMMMEDGLFNFLPKRDNAWIEFLRPLLELARKEKKYLKNKK